MKILAIEKEYEGKTSKDFIPFLENEAKAVWELYKSNIVREIYFLTDQNSAVIIMESESVESARETLAELPLVKEKLIYFNNFLRTL